MSALYVEVKSVGVHITLVLRKTMWIYIALNAINPCITRRQENALLLRHRNIFIKNLLYNELGVEFQVDWNSTIFI